MNKEEAKKQIDADDASINGVKFITTRRAKEIIDAIDDHPKVKLPREVGEELDQFADRYVDVLQFAYHLYALSATEFPALVNWLCSAERRWVIIDAYRYGWEAEPEAKWHVQAPKEWWDDPDVQEWMHLDKSCGVRSVFNNSSRTAFTRYELKHYHLDSDIFTLVPVGESK